MEDLCITLKLRRFSLRNKQGLRQFRSTKDQATYLFQEREDTFQDKKVMLTTWIDLQKAFDKVWTDGLLVKLQRLGMEVECKNGYYLSK